MCFFDRHSGYLKPMDALRALRNDAVRNSSRAESFNAFLTQLAAK